jgi:hypothetical protein
MARCRVDYVGKGVIRSRHLIGGKQIAKCSKAEMRRLKTVLNLGGGGRNGRPRQRRFGEPDYRRGAERDPIAPQVMSTTQTRRLNESFIFARKY